MAPWIASCVCAVGICILFALDRDREGHCSKAIWIPMAWLLLAGSRNVSEWLEPGTYSGNRYLEGNPTDRLVEGILLALCLTVVIRRREQMIALLRANWPIVVFVLYCSLSIVWSDYPTVAFKRWTKLAGDVLMVAIVATDPEPIAAIKRVLKTIGFLLIPISILLIRYYGDWGRTYDRWDGTMFLTGVTTNKNTLGMVCLVVGIGSAWRLLDGWRSGTGVAGNKPLMAQAALLSMTVWLLVKVNSATSLSCFLLAVGLLVITRFWKVARTPSVVSFLTATTVLVPFSALFLSVGTSGLVEGLGRNSTLTGRTYLWNAILSLNFSPVLGVGYESFWIGNRVEQIGQIAGLWPNEAHNGYLEIYITLGWIGLLLLALIIIASYRNIIQGFREGCSASGLRLAFFVTALTYNFTEAAFKMMHPVWIFFLWATLFVPERLSVTEVSEEAESSDALLSEMQLAKST